MLITFEGTFRLNVLRIKLGGTFFFVILQANLSKKLLTNKTVKKLDLSKYVSFYRKSILYITLVRL